MSEGNCGKGRGDIYRCEAGEERRERGEWEGKKKEGGGTGDIWRIQHMLYRCGYHMYVE